MVFHFSTYRPSSFKHLSHLSTSFWMLDAKNNAGCCPSHCQTTDCTSVSDGTNVWTNLDNYVEKWNTSVI